MRDIFILYFLCFVLSNEAFDPLKIELAILKISYQKFSKVFFNNKF